MTEPNQEDPYVWPLTEEVLGWLESDDDQVTTNDAIVEILDDLQAINADLLAALEGLLADSVHADHGRLVLVSEARSAQAARRIVAKAKGVKE